MSFGPAGSRALPRAVDVLTAAVVLLSPCAPAAAAAAPRLVMDGCDRVVAEARDEACVAVALEAHGARVASVGFTIAYDPAVLRVPGGSAVVRKGGALTGGQVVSPVVSGGASSGRLSLMVTPPVRFPIAVIGDGEIATVCFAVTGDAPSGCSVVAFVPGSVDMGDDRGRNLEVGPARDGGVRVRSEAARKLP